MEGAPNGNSITVKESVLATLCVAVADRMPAASKVATFGPSGYDCALLGPRDAGQPGDVMLNIFDSPSSENELYLKLFITNGGGW
jgi:hypothetical protein